MSTLKLVSLLLFLIALVVATTTWAVSNRYHVSQCARLTVSPVTCARVLGHQIVRSAADALMLVPRWLGRRFGGQCERLKRDAEPEQWPTLMLMKTDGGR